MRRARMNIMKKNGIKDKVKIVPAILVILCAVAVSAGGEYVFSELLPKIGHPIFTFFSVLYCDSLRSVVFYLLLLSCVVFMARKKRGAREFKVAYRFFFLVAGVWILILNLFPVSKDYKAVLINGKTPSKLSYKVYILQDAFSGETKTETLSVEQVNPIPVRYHVRGGRGSSGQDITAYYVEYETADNKLFASYESQEVWEYVRWIKEHKDTIQIEYYVHSGIIKAVDGIDKNDKQ